MRKTVTSLLAIALIAAFPALGTADSSSNEKIIKSIVAGGVEGAGGSSSKRGPTKSGEWPSEGDMAEESTTLSGDGKELSDSDGDSINKFFGASEGLREVVNGTILEKAGYVSEDFSPIGLVIDSTYSEQNMFSAPDDAVYLNIGKKDGVNVGDLFTVAHKDIEVTDPETGSSLGNKIMIDGVIRVLDAKGGISMAEVIRSFTPIERGDGLVPYTDPEPATFDPDRPMEDKGIQGRIAAGLINGQRGLASGDIVYFNIGKNDGVSPGDVFDVIGKEKVIRRDGDLVEGLPKVRGQARIIDIKSETSTAILFDCIDSVLTGDVVAFAQVR